MIFIIINYIIKYYNIKTHNIIKYNLILFIVKSISYISIKIKSL